MPDQIGVQTPCPWCGCQMVIPQFCGRFRVTSESPRMFKYRAKCVKCGAKGPESRDLSNATAKAECITKWETRG